MALDLKIEVAPRPFPSSHRKPENDSFYARLIYIVGMGERKDKFGVVTVDVNLPSLARKH